MSHADEAARAAVLMPGTRLNGGSFIVQRVLGRGGFGITYEARDCRQDRLVAIKEFFPLGCARDNDNIFPGGLTTPDAFALAKAQFVEGARVLMGFRHASIVRVSTCFQERNSAYMVMELLRGRTLLEQCENRPLPESEAVAIIEKIGEALETVHRLRLLHLDIKPENVMCEDGGRIVLFDFDLMQQLERSQTYHTRQLVGGSQQGTPGYAPLEQYAQRAHLGIATDVYALGATFYHLLTGDAPPAATDRALGQELHAPRALNASLSARVDEAVMSALQLQPDARPQSVPDFLDALHGQTRTQAVIEAAPVDALMPPLHEIDGWHFVNVASAQPVWPRQCVCCGADTNTALPLKTSLKTWTIPYCLPCARHIRAERNALLFSIIGMLGGLAMAAVGFLMSDIFLGPIGVVVHFTAMAYGVLKSAMADQLMQPKCCEKKIAVAYQGDNGRAHGWKFRSQEFARQFQKLNRT